MIRRIIQIDEEKCNGCGACAEACHEGAIGMVNGKATLLRDDYCDGLGDCLPTCPTGAISFVEREAAAYDEKAVQENMRKKAKSNHAAVPHTGCPGSRMQRIQHSQETTPSARVQTESQLGQWPCQIKLVPTNALLLLKANITNTRKKSLRNLLLFFSDVDEIDLRFVNWNQRYNRSNQTYQLLIGICYLVYNGLLQTQTDGTTEIMDFFDEQRMCHLYEKFLLEYYKKEHPELTANASQIAWQLDDTENQMLPKMQTDIMLSKGNNILIIDAKYYSHMTQQQYGTNTLHSNNLYQIFTYVKNKEFELRNVEHTVSGMLLYAQTNEDIIPHNTYQMSGNQITVRALNLNQNFSGIADELDAIINNSF